MTTESGTSSDSIPYCPDVDGDGVADPPPSHGQIVAALCPTSRLPEPVLGTSPPDRGVTGLETWLWSDGDHDYSSSGTVAGYPSTCTARATWFAVDTGDVHAAEFGHPRTYASADPGHDGEDTGMRHPFERTGSYAMTLTVTWSRTTDAGSDRATRSTTRDYPVVEIVAVQTTDPSE